MENKTSRSRKGTPQARQYSERLTLEEYMQAYNLRKKISQRKRSKSKAQVEIFQEEQLQKEQNIFMKLDKFSDETKLSLTQKLDDLEISRQKLFFQISKLLDKLILDLKTEISRLYKDVYAHYKIQIQKRVSSSKEKDANQSYFRDKKEEARQEMLKTNTADAIKEHLKVQNKNGKIIHNLLHMVSHKQLNSSRFHSQNPRKQHNNEEEKDSQNMNNLHAEGFFIKLIEAKEKSEPKVEKSPRDQYTLMSPKANNTETMKVGAKPFERKPSAGYIRKLSNCKK